MLHKSFTQVASDEDDGNVLSNYCQFIPKWLRKIINIGEVIKRTDERLIVFVKETF